MGKKDYELSTGMKNMIIEMLGNGFSRRKIGNALNIPKSMVIFSD
jgi:transposase-like protein